MKQLNKNDFKNIIQNNLIYGLYRFNTPSMPNYVKIGCSSNMMDRCTDDLYFTPHGANGDFRLFFSRKTTDETSARKDETKLKIFLKENNFKVGTSGQEVYLDTNNLIISIDDYIKNEINYEYVIDIDVKSIRDLKTNSFHYITKENRNNLVNFHIVTCDHGKCEKCNKIIKRLYKVVYMNANEPCYQTLGSECFKKMFYEFDVRKQNLLIFNKQISSIFRSSKHETMRELGFNNSPNNDEFIINKITLKEVIDEFLRYYLTDGRTVSNFISKIDNLDIGTIPFNTIRIYTLWIFCCWFFANVNNKNKSFEQQITIEDYNLSIENSGLNISFLFLISVLQESYYFQLSNISIDIFTVNFIHHEINSNFLTEYFSSLKRVENTEKYIPPKKDKLNLEQQLCYKNTNPFIFGDPGTGKSHVVENIIKNSSLSNMIITPTYESMHNIKGKMDKKYIIDYNVIASINPFFIEKQESVNGELRLFVDEIGMFNIFDFYRLYKLIKVMGIDDIYMLGDIHQLPCIEFAKETNNILKTIDNRANKLVENIRFTSENKSAKFILGNKKDYRNLDFIKQLDVKPLRLMAKITKKNLLFYH